MKKSILSAISLMVIMASCSTQVDEVISETPAEVTFQVANYVAQTKAAAAKVPVLFPTDDTFGMFAWYDAANSGTQHQTFMNNEVISFDSTNKQWKASQTYFWPKTGNLDFLGYYPYSTTPWINSNGGTTTMTGSASVTGTEDYMFADLAMDYQKNVKPASFGFSGVTEGVPMLFHHALAKVSINAKVDKLFNKDTEAESDVVWEVKILQMTMEDILTDGTVNFTNTYTAGTTAQQIPWTPTSTIWTPTSTTGTDINANPEGVSVLTLNDQATLTDWTVLPQDLTGKVLYIKYELKTTTATGEITELIEREIPLADDTILEEWSINDAVTYDLVISPSTDEILFDPAIEIWDSINIALPESTSNSSN